MFHGLKQLDIDAAVAIAASRARFLALGVTALDVATARVLACLEGERLSIDCLTTLDTELASMSVTIIDLADSSTSRP